MSLLDPCEFFSVAMLLASMTGLELVTVRMNVREVTWSSLIGTSLPQSNWRVNESAGSTMVSARSRTASTSAISGQPPPTSTVA